MKPTKTHLLLLLTMLFTLGCAALSTTTSGVTSYAELLSSSENVRGLTFKDYEKLSSSLKGDTQVLKISWNLWKAKRWKQLQNYFWVNNLNDSYPPAQGFIEVEVTTLAQDSKIDRYGGYYGKFFANTGTPFGQRALRANSLKSKYSRFNVIAPIDSVLKGKAIPWFNQPGRGTQYMTNKDVFDLIKANQLVVLDSMTPASVPQPIP